MKDEQDGKNGEPLAGITRSNCDKKEYPGSWHHRKDGRRNSGAYIYNIGFVL